MNIYQTKKRKESIAIVWKHAFLKENWQNNLNPPFQPTPLFQSNFSWPLIFPNFINKNHTTPPPPPPTPSSFSTFRGEETMRTKCRSWDFRFPDISGQSLIKENCPNSRTNDDINMKLGRVTKLDKKKKTISKTCWHPSTFLCSYFSPNI